MPGTTTVACKLPHGLILRLFDMVDVDEAVAGGGYRTVKRSQPRPGVVELKGYLTKHRGALIQAPAEGSSFALTEGVDKDFFDEWMKQNQAHPAVVNKLIFGSEKADTVRGLTREHKDARSGLEPLDPSKLPRGIKTFTKDEAA